ncbi:MAG: hypothetical protein LBC83_00775 [Oscillospiraceae bacterium]|jgi:hypothetical protein|nr:hypothetical protein [Oscillospiraceae bacterium]
MASSVTERDFEMFAVPASAPVPGRRPAARPAPVREPRVLPAKAEESFKRKKEKARIAWKKTAVAFGVSAVVSLCLFGATGAELSFLQANNEKQALLQELNYQREVAINRQAAIEQKYSLEIVQDYALNKLHMVPIEGGRMWYLQHPGGDTVLK